MLKRLRSWFSPYRTVRVMGGWRYVERRVTGDRHVVNALQPPIWIAPPDHGWLDGLEFGQRDQAYARPDLDAG